MDASPIALPAEPTLQADQAGTPEVALGLALPAVSSVPLLAASQRLEVDAAAARPSKLGQGLIFKGDAWLNGPITVAGRWEGDIAVQEGCEGRITVTESGQVDGDLSARHVSILGQTHGEIDAAGGSVSLHGSARVNGHIRYAHLQVNGAELNAQLERVSERSASPPGAQAFEEEPGLGTRPD
jgi:cytoskeletal protein CcmA (bactofilin family)